MVNKPNTSASAEEIVAKFYNTGGWETHDGITEDAARFEDLRKSAEDYLRLCRLRLLKFIPPVGHNFLDMASGPIQYPEYILYSKGYDKRYCVDLSLDALKQAEVKIGNHGVYLHGSFFDLPIEDNFFDCAVSIHTIYHMDKDTQADAVRKLIRVTKKGAPVIIIYSNPNALTRQVTKVGKRVVSLFRKPKSLPIAGDGTLYFHCHELSWWKQFSDSADMKIVPWRTFGTEVQKKLFPDNSIGKIMFNTLFFLEDSFSYLFTKIATYPIIILTKK